MLGNPAAPTFNSYARRYASLTRYYAVTHPSLPNYIALVSGSTRGIKSNCTRCTVNAPNLADTLEASGKTWKSYAEGLPSRGFLGGSSGRYAKKHNPFAYFRSIAGNADRRDRIVPLRELAPDLRAGRLPDFAFVVPDLCNSMHDCSVAVGDSWLRRTVTPLLGLPQQCRLRALRRRVDERSRRRPYGRARPRHGGAARRPLRGRHGPLRRASHHRGRLGAPAARPVGDGAADRGHLGVELERGPDLELRLHATDHLVRELGRARMAAEVRGADPL